MTTLTAPTLSRRSLLKVGLLGGAVLATAGVTVALADRFSSTAADGYQALRPADLPILAALVPVMLEGSVAPERLSEASNSTLLGLDAQLAHLSPEMLKLTRQMLDVLALPVTRGPLTGIWGGWESASPEAVRNFLGRWENSSLALLRMGHASLLQLILMAWYARPESWAHCGYPGPPTV
ncbi:MAG TPA: twin-arginine translocation pathway signal protein [Pseudomonas sp.]|nr:twin-arginine translocation pathway signal protein [Pseudomonas sp.]